MRSKKSSRSFRPAACKVNSYPALSVSSKISRAPLLTPPNSSPSKQTSNFAASMEYSRASPPITPPISPPAGRSSRPWYDSLDKPTSHRKQIDAQSTEAPRTHSGIISFLGTREEEQLSKVRKEASRNHWNANRHEPRRATRGTAETDGGAEMMMAWVQLRSGRCKSTKIDVSRPSNSYLHSLAPAESVNALFSGLIHDSKANSHSNPIAR